MTGERRAWADEDVRDGDDDVRDVRVSNRPDRDGCITVERFRTNTYGQKVKVTMRVRQIKKKIRVNPRIEERANIRLNLNETEGTQATVCEEVFIEQPKRVQAVHAEDRDEDYYFHDLPKEKANVWSKYRKTKDDEDEETKEEEGKEGENKEAGKETGAPGRYIAPHLRKGMAGRPGMSGDPKKDEKDECTVRVTNLTEEVTQTDLQNLFGNCGNVSRVFIAKQRDNPQTSKGFAFVTFYRRQDAEKAIKMLNGHGYDHLILSVEWAKPTLRDKEKKDVK